jgi:hypothetical protein
VGHDAEDAEEVVFAEVVVDGGMKVGGGDLPEAAAAEVVEGDGSGVVVGEVAVVAGEVFSEGVGDDFTFLLGLGHAVVKTPVVGCGGREPMSQ